MPDADRYDALLEAGRRPVHECSLCGRMTEREGFGPCSEACEEERIAHQARLAEVEWVDKWMGRPDDEDPCVPYTWTDDDEEWWARRHSPERDDDREEEGGALAALGEEVVDE